MTEHRVKTLSTLLPIALATGYSDIEHDFEPLKVLLFTNRIADSRLTST